jgi:hypothetical protein
VVRDGRGVGIDTDRLIRLPTRTRQRAHGSGTVLSSGRPSPIRAVGARRYRFASEPDRSSTLGYVLGSYVQLVMVFGPAVLILFARRTRGWTKARWVFLSLLPWLIGQVVLLVWFLVASRESQLELPMFGSSGIYVATWLGAWIVYLFFLSLFKKPSAVRPRAHESADGNPPPT